MSYNDKCRDCHAGRCSRCKGTGKVRGMFGNCASCRGQGGRPCARHR